MTPTRGSDQDFFGISRVGLGRVGSGRNRDFEKKLRVGSGHRHPTRPDLTVEDPARPDRRGLIRPVNGPEYIWNMNVPATVLTLASGVCVLLTLTLLGLQSRLGDKTLKL